MFYCDTCAKKKKWPIGLVRSQGPCEVCGKTDNCSDVQSSQLPPASVSVNREPPPYFENPDFERFYKD
jgi:hypothetical protein